ncbi:MAG: hypothetical protein J3K34DRAFT_434047 [Monoraphidium minutum]|nr:MAG: hypothetical protein J3K34DRAFT_434047 [Monoraphidium minutum]
MCGVKVAAFGLLLLAGFAQGQRQCTSVDEASQPFGLSVATEAVTRTSTSKKGTTIYTRYCFQLTNNAAHGDGRKPCDAGTCCDSKLTLGTIVIGTDPSCTTDKTAGKILQKTRWTLDGAKLRGKFNSKLSEYHLRLKDWSRPSAALCLESTDFHGGTALPNPCPTLDKLCGPRGCRLQVTTEQFRQAKSRVTCCANWTLPVDCPLGKGSVDGYACQSCPAGTFQNATSTGPLPKCSQCAPLEIAVNTGSSACTPCPSGQYADETRTSCLTSSTCNQGRGGAACELCLRGTWSAGGDADDPFPACLDCPTGSTTLGTGSASANDCNGVASACAQQVASLVNACFNLHVRGIVLLPCVTDGFETIPLSKPT